MDRPPYEFAANIFRNNAVEEAYAIVKSASTEININVAAIIDWLSLSYNVNGAPSILCLYQAPVRAIGYVCTCLTVLILLAVGVVLLASSPPEATAPPRAPLMYCCRQTIGGGVELLARHDQKLENIADTLPAYCDVRFGLAAMAVYFKAQLTDN
jgi:hypothetical protein